MTVKELEQRIEVLEAQVRELQSVQTAAGGRVRDWRAAVEKYAGDEGLLSVFAEAQKLREKDRERARRKYAGKRKSKS
jgi:phosphoribosyl-dephospho-CoA transferase